MMEGKWNEWIEGFEAAERINQWNESAGGSGSPYKNGSGYTLENDIKLLRRWADHEMDNLLQWIKNINTKLSTKNNGVK